MADTKIGNLTELAVTPATGDQFFISDISEAADNDKGKYITWGTIDAAIDTIIAASSQPLNANLTAIAALSPTKGNLLVGNGSAWVALGVGTDTHVITADSAEANGIKWAAAGGLSDIVDDTTPQLGGNLDVNGNSIVSVSAGDITLTPDTTGSIVLDGLNWPQADGSSGQFLTTDGAGQLSFDTVSTTKTLADVATDSTTTAHQTFALNSGTSLIVEDSGGTDRFTITESSGLALFAGRVSSQLNGVTTSEFFGSGAGNTSVTGANNTGVGNGALSSITSGTSNTVLGGNNAGSAITTGVNNSIFGAGGGAVLTGSNNTLFGTSAGAALTSGGSNVFLGNQAGSKQTTSSNNVMVGPTAGFEMLTGDHATYVGLSAGRNNKIGRFTTAIGSNALLNNTAQDNVGLGRHSGIYNTSGVRNTYLGNSNGPASGDGGHNNTIALGYGATTDDDNQLVVGSSTYDIRDIRFPGTTRPLIREEDAGTNAVLNIIGIGHRTTGTAASGFGAGFNVVLDSSTTADQDAGGLSVEWDVATHASRAATLKLYAYYTSNQREAFEAIATSSGVDVTIAGTTNDKFAVFDAAPAAQQSHIADPSGGGTQDAEARTAINSILSILETFGLTATS